MIRRFHQIMLSICGIFVLIGIFMMFLGKDTESVDQGMWMTMMAGALAGVPLFYFASQVTFRQSDRKLDPPEEER